MPGAASPPPVAQSQLAAVTLPTRASDMDRQGTVELLRHHWLAGRLSLEEFEARAAEVWSAVWIGDLWRAVRELPVAAPAAAPAARATHPSGALACGIVSVCLLVLSFGLLSVFTLPLAACAWILGRKARRAGHGTQALVGEVLGVTGTVTSAMVLAGCAALVAG